MIWKLSKSREKWKVLFLAFGTLAMVACALALLTVTFVLPQLHDNSQEIRSHQEFIHPDLGVSGLQKQDEHYLKKRRHDDTLEKSRPLVDMPKGSTDTAQKYYMVFSTGCTPFQNWQGLSFFYFARKVRQPGTITRLLSGCSPEEAERLQKVHDERVKPLAIAGLQEFEIHVTPNFDQSHGGDQKYFNKPNGLLHWMKESLGMEDVNGDHKDNDAIVIIVDPDMMLLRPITNDVGVNNYVGGWVDTKNTRKHHAEGNDVVNYTNNIVRHGAPHAQKYEYGSKWITSVKSHLSEIVPPGSPVLTMTNEDAADYYPAGPPYIATAKDMYQIAVHWVEFLPKYHKYFKGMMCEMHSYSMAAAHLNLPHKLAAGFMVSDVAADGENFDFIDTKLTKSTCCMNAPELQVKKDTGVVVPINPHDTHHTMTDPAYKQNGIDIRNLPFVLHFCQRYALGRYFFSKYKLMENIFDDCEAPMMIEPPRDVAEIYDWNIFPNGIEMWDFSLNSKKIFHKRHGWMLCVVVYGMNEAIQYFKEAKCGKDPKYFKKTWHFHTEANFSQAIQNTTNPL